jgi:DNA polymerase-3 subunit beta
MRFEISRKALDRVLVLAANVVERRQTLQVLANACLTLEGNRLTVTTTDLEMEFRGTVTVDKAADGDGEITVPARKLADIWRSMPEDGIVSFVTGGERAVVSSGRARFTLATIPASDFPSAAQLADDLEVTLPAASLRRLIDGTSFSMAQQDVRYFLNGMLIEFTREHLRAVATDGHRLAVCTLRDHASDVDRYQVIVPRKGIGEIGRLLADRSEAVRIAVGHNHLRLVAGDDTMTTKLIDGKFPDYERVIPRLGSVQFTADRGRFRSALGRVAILCNEQLRGVRLGIGSGQLKLNAHNAEQEEAEELIDVEASGGALEVAFNISYLQDVLGAMQADTVRMSVADGNHSALLQSPEDDSCQYVVMPTRL